MPRRTPQLSPQDISSAKPEEKEYNLADGGGLMLRVKPNGTKHWIFNYLKPYTKKRTNISLGLLSNVSLKEARKQRDLYKELLEKDIDPKVSRKEQKQNESLVNSNTFKLVATQWFELKKKKIADRYSRNIWNSFENHIFPFIGDIPITKLTAVQAIEALKPVAARGSLETTKRLAQRINEVMVFAINSGFIEYNSLAGIGKVFDSPQETHLPTLKPAEIPELIETIDKASIKVVTRNLIKFQLHTMVRPSEAAGAKWCEIDFENRLWVIPADRMKNKRKDKEKQAHTVPLSGPVIQILKAMKPISQYREHAFPSDINPRKPVNSETVNMALKRMGFKGRIVSHGFRALASTALNEHGFDRDLIEKALAHVDPNEVRAAYNRAEYIERRREMMEWWSSLLHEV